VGAEPPERLEALLASATHNALHWEAEARGLSVQAHALRDECSRLRAMTGATIVRAQGRLLREALALVRDRDGRLAGEIERAAADGEAFAAAVG
jgi:hypothetical protein